MRSLPVVRSLWRRRSFSLVVVITIALVVGPSVAILAVVDAALVRPLPGPASERLVQLNTLPPGLTDRQNWNPLGSVDFVRLRTQNHSLEAVTGLWARERALVAGGGEPESVKTGLVSENFFEMFGGTPAAGRAFTADEDHANAKVAVISYGLWQRRFGADPAIVGRQVELDREPFEIVGVMGPAFRPGFFDLSLWTPLNLHEGNVTPSGSTFIQTIARMRPGRTPADVQSDLAAIMTRVGAEAPQRRGWHVVVTDWRTAQFGDVRPALWLLLAATIGILLLAVANLTNLVAAETTARVAELAVRAALGASRSSLLVLFAGEGVVLATLGALLGVTIGMWMLPLMLALDPTARSTFGDVTVDWRVQLLGIAVSLLVSVVAGVVPALVATRGDLAGSVRAGGRAMVGSRAGRRMRAALVTAQTALAVVLLAAAGLMLAGFSKNSQLSPGFDPQSVVAAQVRLPAVAYPTANDRVQFVDRMIARVGATPGVVAVGITHNLFVPGFTFQTLVTIDGHPSADGEPYTVGFRRVSPEYFATLRVPVVAGRAFTTSDISTSQLVTVISEGLARLYFPGESALGRQIRRGKDLLTVVGVVGDVRDVSLAQVPSPTLYIPYAQNNNATVSIGLVVRTAASPAAMTRTIERAIHEVDPAQPLSSVTTLDAFLAGSLGPQRFRGVALGWFAGLGLLLAALGIYGMVARQVAERTREVGVRLAFGATPGAVRRLVLLDAWMPIAVGFAIGGACAIAAVLAMRHGIAELEGIGPLASILSTIALAAVAAVASGLPALSAARVDPMQALRAES